MNIQRFILKKTATSVWQITDLKDDLPVCVITRNGRDPARQEAMMKVMLDALNAAVDARSFLRRNGHGPDGPPSGRNAAASRPRKTEQN